jgi:hypothetical protein
LAENHAFGSELENGGGGIGAKLKRETFGRRGAELFIRKEAGFGSVNGDAAGRKRVKLKLAFGIRESGQGGTGGSLNEGIVNGIASDGIEDYAAKSARAGGIWGRLLRGEARSKKERRRKE